MTLPADGQPRTLVDRQRSKSEIVTVKVSMRKEEGPGSGAEPAAASACQTQSVGRVDQTVYESTKGQRQRMWIYIRLRQGSFMLHVLCCV